MSNRIHKKLITGISMLIVLLLQGCPSIPWYPYYPLDAVGPCRTAPENLLAATDMKTIFDTMASELCADPSANPSGYSSPPQSACAVSAHRTVLVTDFVDIRNLAPNQHGLLMGELMRSSLNNRCCLRIVQVEFAKYFRLGENGLVALTRDINEIKKDDYGETECVVGTYSFLEGKLLLFARRINIVSGRITRMVTREISYDCTGDRITCTVK